MSEFIVVVDRLWSFEGSFERSFVGSFEGSFECLFRLFIALSWLINFELKSVFDELELISFEFDEFDKGLSMSPFNFGKLYGKIEILNSYRYRDTFLLPHSSILSFLVFFGAVGLICLIIYLIIRVWKNRKSISLEGYLILTYIVINLIKSDSINYFPSALFYFSIIYLFINLNNDLIFNKRIAVNNS